jgi:DNA-binding MarR family transcriptional regulator
MGILVQAPCHSDTAKYPILLGSWNPISTLTYSVNLPQASNSPLHVGVCGKHESGTGMKTEEEAFYENLRRHTEEHEKRERRDRRRTEQADAELQREDRERYVNYKAIKETVLFILPKKDLTAGAKLVAIALAKRADKERGTCFPGIDTICRDTGLSKPAVLRARTELEKAGYLGKRPGKGKRRSYTYELDWLW